MKKYFGFTLMEVLVALVIIAIAFPCIFMAISSNARNLIYSKNKTTANWVGMNVMAKIQMNLVRPGGTLPEPETLLNQSWYWTAKTSNTQNPTVLQVDVEVRAAPDAAPLVHLIGFLRKEIA